MTVAVENPDTIYSPTGTATGPFATVWSYAAATEVVVLIETDGVEGAPLAAGTGYTLVSTPRGAGGYTGAVTLTASGRPVNGWQVGATQRLVVRRRTRDAQDQPFGQVDGFRPPTSEAAWDADARRSQEHRAGYARAVKAPAGEAGFAYPPLAQRASKWAFWDVFGNLIGAAGAVMGVPVTEFMASVLTISTKAGFIDFLGLVPAIDHYGGDGTGVVDASTAVAAANLSGRVLTLAGRTYRISQDTTISAPLAVEVGASFTIDAGKTLTITGDLDVRGHHQVFKGAGSVVLAGNNRDVEALWFGGSIADVAPGVLKAFNAGARHIHLPQMPCGWTTGIKLDTSAGARWLDLWFHNDVAMSAAGITALGYRRPGASNTGMVLALNGDNVVVYETGLGQHGRFLDFRGTAVTSGMTITRSGSTVTVGVTAHGLTVGKTAYIETIDQPEYSGAWTVASVPNANTFTFNIGSATPASPATGPLCLAGHETGHFNDNRVKVTGIEFRGFFRGMYTTRTSGWCRELIGRFNAVTWESGRDSSFFKIEDYLGVGNKTGIYYIDPVADALSNGVTLNHCYEVFAGGSGSQGGMVFAGIQGLLGKGNSIDICSGGSYCLSLVGVTDAPIEFIWISSDLVTSPSHRGVSAVECFRSELILPVLVNQAVGVVTDVGTKSADNSMIIRLGVTENVQLCNWLDFGSDGATIPDGYDIRTACPRTGANYEFYQASGGKTFLGEGKMRGSSYTPSLGAGSVVTSPRFI